MEVGELRLDATQEFDVPVERKFGVHPALHQDLGGNEVRSAVLETGWVDVKVSAVDEDWSGLKFLKRR